jgi:hypothetical protein
VENLGKCIKTLDNPTVTTSKIWSRKKQDAFPVKSMAMGLPKIPWPEFDIIFASVEPTIGSQTNRSWHMSLSA